MITRFLFPVFFVCLAVAASAPADSVERLDSETLEKVVKPLADAHAKFTDLPFKITLDTKGATGLKAGKAAAVVMPAEKLTATALEKIDRDVVPVAVIFLRKITPVVAEEAVPADQNRSAEVTVGEKTAAVNVLHLGVSRVAGRLVLLAWTKGKTPALVTELVSTEEKSEHPVNIDAKEVGKNRAALMINILSRYRAAIPLAGQEDS